MTPARILALTENSTIQGQRRLPMLGGEAFLARVFSAYRSATSAAGASVWKHHLADRVG